MNRLKDWFGYPWIWIDTAFWPVIIIAVIVWTGVLFEGRPPDGSMFEPGQEVRLKANGGKAVVVRRVGGDYLVRYSEHDGRLNTLVMDSVELVDWPSSYQVPKPEPK